MEVADQIIKRRRQILVHSIIYYRMGENLIDDYTWSQWAAELRDLQNKFPKIAERLPWGKEFKDFDGSTGMDLPLGDPWAQNKARQLMLWSKRW